MTGDTGVIAILFGPPGSGKGTQAAYIADTFDLLHVSTGEMLRAEVARGTSLGREVEEVMKSGELVSDDLIVRLIEAHLADREGHQGVLLDGFPRTVPQAGALDAMLARTSRAIDVLLFLDVPSEELRRRILRRAEEEERADDTPDAVATRLDVYERETAPVLDHYREGGVAVRRIDGVGDIDDVRARIRAAFPGAHGGTVSS